MATVGKAVLVTSICGLAALVVGCGGGDGGEALTANSTCEDYLAQSQEVRHDTAVRISSDLGTESPGNPMWGLSLDAACGSDPSRTIGEIFQHEDSPVDESGGPTDAIEEQSEEVSAQESSVVDGTFQATPGGGYTLDVGYDISQLEVEVDIANAAPGEAILEPIINGQLTFTNTTPQRNTTFGPIYELPSLGFFWTRSQLPPGTECQGDGLELGGAVNCILTSVRADSELATDSDGLVHLEPDGTVAMPLETISLGSTSVPEENAEAIAELIRSTKPSLVLVDIDGLEPGYDTCEIGPTEFTAALTGAGEVVANSAEAASC